MKIFWHFFSPSQFKNAIPQYRVGHQKILDDIKLNLDEEKLGNQFYLTGFSYEGIGLNDCIFNARNLVENELVKNPIFSK